MEDLEIKADVKNKIIDREAHNEKWKMARNWLTYEIESAENKAEILEEEVFLIFLKILIFSIFFEK